jgi:hypothetical protein
MVCAAQNRQILLHQPMVNAAQTMVTPAPTRVRRAVQAVGDAFGRRSR